MLSIIVPTYNESGNIELLVSRLESAVSGSHEIIFVDDNSNDGTQDIIQKISRTNLSVRLVNRSEKLGLTSAIVAGAQVAKGNIIVVMDADLSHPPELVPKLAGSLQDCDLVLGCRAVVQNWPFHRQLISKGAELLARILFGISVRDPLSGFFAIKKPLLTQLKLRAKGYKILLNILVDNQKLRINEIPYEFYDRHSGKTKLGSREMINYLLDLLRLRFGRP